MIQRVPGGLPLSGGYHSAYGVNIQDSLNLDNSQSIAQPGTSILTPGATLIAPINITPPIQTKWSLQALAVKGYLFASLRNPSYGKTGKFIVGLLMPTDQGYTFSTVGASGNFTPNILPLPDPSLSLDLWNPDNDPYPPVYNPIANPLPQSAPLQSFLPVSAVIQLPQSVDLLPGEQVYIGIWQLPSLIGGWSLNHFPPGPTAGVLWNMALTQTSYVLTYDDNL